MQQLLVVDVETGGLDPFSHSILSLSACAWTMEKTVPLFSTLIDEGGKLYFTSEAMHVNKLSLADIKSKGLSPQATVKGLRKALDGHYGADRDKLILAGNNINFDHSFLQRLFWLAGEKMGRDFSPFTLDVFSILRAEQLKGNLPEGPVNSKMLYDITGLCPDEEDMHTAKGDCYSTAEALRCILNEVHLK